MADALSVVVNCAGKFNLLIYTVPLISGKMKPEDITLENMSKIFEYEKQSREIDRIENPIDLRNLAKSFLKLYLKQQEVLKTIDI